MNDLPQNELLSAYLDGELTAAEQAEMERLLAESPAARQLLGELRAVRNMLQSLPHEKLTEDLSRQVLRVAERRMLTEEEPGAAEVASTARVPLGRSLVRRFLNRRTMTWLALAATIAIMIRISERWQRVEPVVDANNRIALVKPPQPATGPAAPPSIRAAGDQKPTIGQTAFARQMLRAANAGESVSLVRCNISPDAAQKQAFEKLLDANGVVWRQRPEPSWPSGGELKEKVTRQAQQLPSDRSLFWQSTAAGEENLVEVEATAAQLDATLAGLKAQPDLFRSFSVQPNLHAYRRETSAFGAGGKNRLSSQPTAGKSPLAAEASSKAEQHVQSHVQRQPPTLPPARQRVLFVLHVVGDHPPAAAKAPDGLQINAAKSAEQAAPPTGASKPRK